MEEPVGLVVGEPQSILELLDGEDLNAYRGNRV